MAKLTAQVHGKAILITGDTKAVKDLLKGQGGRWNNGLTGWIFQASKKEAVLGALRQAGNEVNDDTGAAVAATPEKATNVAEAQPAAKKQKTGTSAAAESDEPWSRPLTPGEPSSGNRRRVSVSAFNGEVMVDIREWYGDASDPKPGKKGIALKAEEWKLLKQAMPDIDSELKRLQDS
eukprot:TRINITY_DN95582_c0_g1_i1.p1 TRINITY_DN95582_c0_g1~~TRINITY_DN95582_c0_g1_i1.p1  ORF type:complete len:187 (+),score=49.18 TRINITY_DN95582_c0_g1_i1:30-563(+)